MAGTMELTAVILAAAGREPVITGLTPSKRARRVIERAGVARDRIHVVRTVADAAALRARPVGSLLVVRATDQIVAPSLLEPLRLREPGARHAMTAAGVDAGALRVDADQARTVLDSLRCGVPALALAAGAQPVVVDERARHPAGTDAELRAARVWQWQLVHKPLDAFLTRRFWRPVARPLTRLALRLPFTPNMISVACIATSVAGGAIASRAGWTWHVLGLALCFFASALDNVDGEVARLRHEGSRLGGWLDTIGDDVARMAILAGIYVHVAREHPGWPIAEIGVVTAALTALSCGLLYWWCVVVGKTSNNQEYAAVVGAQPQGRTVAPWTARVVDLGAAMARRDFIDIGVFVLGVAGLSVVSALGLAIGAVVGAAVIVPNHLRIVAARA